MGRLDDIVARNKKHLAQRQGLLGAAQDFIESELDPNADPIDRRNRRLALGGIAVIVVGIVLAIMLWPSGGAAGGEVYTRDGRKIELSTLWRDHRVLVVFYPGAGCPSCTYILTDLDARRAAIHADVIGVSSHPRRYADELHEQLGLHFELYSDPTFKVIPKWGVHFVTADATESAVFLVETDGTISYQKIGTLPPTDEIVAAVNAPPRS